MAIHSATKLTDCHNCYTPLLPQASTHILGDEERGKTRSETRKISLSDEEKPAVKRANTMEQTAKVTFLAISQPFSTRG